MRLTVIRDGGVIIVDGEGYRGALLDALPVNIHAIQWYDTVGEIEWKHPDSTGLVIVENEKIDDISPYLWCVDVWQSRKNSVAAESVDIGEGLRNATGNELG